MSAPIPAHLLPRLEEGHAFACQIMDANIGDEITFRGLTYRVEGPVEAAPGARARDCRVVAKTDSTLPLNFVLKVHAQRNRPAITEYSVINPGIVERIGARSINEVQDEEIRELRRRARAVEDFTLALDCDTVLSFRRPLGAPLRRVCRELGVRYE
jgi:hypothetical protein